jgi:hypothetical protein
MFDKLALVEPSESLGRSSVWNTELDIKPGQMFRHKLLNFKGEPEEVFDVDRLLKT